MNQAIKNLEAIGRVNPTLYQQIRLKVLTGEFNYLENFSTESVTKAASRATNEKGFVFSLAWVEFSDRYVREFRNMNQEDRLLVDVAEEKKHLKWNTQKTRYRFMGK